MVSGRQSGRRSVFSGHCPSVISRRSAVSGQRSAAPAIQSSSVVRSAGGSRYTVFCRPVRHTVTRGLGRRLPGASGHGWSTSPLRFSLHLSPVPAPRSPPPRPAATDGNRQRRSGSSLGRRVRLASHWPDAGACSDVGTSVLGSLLSSEEMERCHASSTSALVGPLIIVPSIAAMVDRHAVCVGISRSYK